MGAQPTDVISAVFGDDAAWSTRLATASPGTAQGLATFLQGSFGSTVLSVREKALLAAGLSASRCEVMLTAHFARAAVSAGATYGELAELFAACILSRGVQPYRVADAVLRELFPKETAGLAGSAPPAFRESGAEILAEFQQYYGSVPPQARRLAQVNEQALAGYYQMRTEVLRDNLLPRRLKELLYIAINAADLYAVGIRIHARGALAAGATPEEVVAAALLAVPLAGIVAWLEAHPVLEEILGDDWSK